MKTTHEGREYALQASPMPYNNLSAHLVERGFDGKTYFGISMPTGRQRKQFGGIFYRSVKTGEFVHAIRA